MENKNLSEIISDIKEYNNTLENNVRELEKEAERLKKIVKLPNQKKKENIKPRFYHILMGYMLFFAIIVCIHAYLNSYSAINLNSEFIYQFYSVVIIGLLYIVLSQYFSIEYTYEKRKDYFILTGLAIILTFFAFGISYYAYSIDLKEEKVFIQDELLEIKLLLKKGN